MDDEVRAHVPELRGTGYDGTRVADVLTMTTGVDWVEDHRDPDSLASALLGCFAEGGDSRALLGRVRPGVAPGTRWSYCTADSQVLDWVRERATGRSFVEDLALMWADLGCTDDAVVGVDGHGVALAGGALAATARDWTRLGLLAATGTSWDGQRLHDPGWTADAGRPAYPFTAPGRLPSTISAHVGFGRPLVAARRRRTASRCRRQPGPDDRGGPPHRCRRGQDVRVAVRRPVGGPALPRSQLPRAPVSAGRTRSPRPGQPDDTTTSTKE